ncbi:hypothetical protein [Dysgonomonas capnocytophagoides]|uniref:hypothetical protein n=1 Tax=Dysgonomonas capnocytophagoides TaxID=45254 RepID=UPI002924E001|nr:hypothetical protein DCPSUM001_33700 [Dysgonomonas capnocytophagoides]
MKIGLRKWLGKQGSNKKRHFVLYRHEKTIYKRIAKRKWKRIIDETYHCPVDNHIVDVTEIICRYCEGCEMIMDKLDDYEILYDEIKD